MAADLAKFRHIGIAVKVPACSTCLNAAFTIKTATMQMNLMFSLAPDDQTLPTLKKLL